MNDTTNTYEAPEVIESLDELDVLGNTPATPTAVAGSGLPINVV